MNSGPDFLMAKGGTALRAPEASDVPFLRALRNDVALQTQLLSLPRPNSDDRVREWIGSLARDEASLFFIIHAVAEAAPVGFIQVREMHMVHRRGVLGICLAEAARGQGHGSAAMEMMEDFARRVFGLRKLTLQVLASNTEAVRLYERSGYTTVGVLRGHFMNGGFFHDVALMEKFLAAEVPA